MDLCLIGRISQFPREPPLLLLSLSFLCVHTERCGQLPNSTFCFALDRQQNLQILSNAQCLLMHHSTLQFLLVNNSQHSSQKKRNCLYTLYLSLYRRKSLFLIACIWWWHFCITSTVARIGYTFIEQLLIFIFLT